MRQGRGLGVLLVALITATMSAPAFAEVQNVKVGGDITVRGIWRQNFDLRNDGHFITNPGATSDLGGHTNEERFIFSTVGVNLTADLTDNVSADIRLSNQRDWGANIANGSATGGNNDVQVSRAYVTMKELLYSPLTVKIGRQPLWFGKGFIVGSRLLAGDTNVNGNFSATEWTDQTGFDAIRATLDFNPATIDVVYSKTTEGTADANDDVNLTGVNAGYKFSSMNAEVEAYYWNLYMQTTGQQITGIPDNLNGNINTMGVRGSLEPITHSSVWGELAYQFGRVGGGSGQAQQAWAFDAGSDYTLADVAWTPKLGAEWIFYSGGQKLTQAGGWNPVYRGKFDSMIREFMGSIYATDTPTDTASTTNQHQIAIFGAIKPTDSIKVDTRLSWFAADTGISIDGLNGGKTPHFFGTEWDSKATYDYTEDVQFGLMYGVFWPGDVFRNVSASAGRTDIVPGGRATAQELISSVRVKF